MSGDTLYCPNCLEFGHVLGDCPKPRVKDEPEQDLNTYFDGDDDDLCSACERPSLDCSKKPCPEVWADRGLPTLRVGQLVVALKDQTYGEPYWSAPAGTVGIVHAGEPDPDGDYQIIWPADPDPHFATGEDVEPVTLPPTHDNDALEAWLEGVST